MGRILGASNATLLGVVRLDGVEQSVVYKPVRGERPLWDFPDGTLAGREVAAWRVCQAGEWGVVPPTVLRDGPAGPGSVQQWVGDLDAAGSPVASEPGADLVDALHPDRVPPGWLTVVEGTGYDDEPVVVAHADDPGLRSMALFDAVINNADRKGGHVLRGGAGAGAGAGGAGAAGPAAGPGGGGSGAVLGVDHGLAMHAEPKLRTVLWGWGGQRLDDAGRECLERTAAASEELVAALAPLVTRDEVSALAERVAQLLARGRHPRPGPGGPSLPWPLF